MNTYFLIDPEEALEDFKKSKLTGNNSLYAVSVKCLYEDCIKHKDYYGCIDIFNIYKIKYKFANKGLLGAFLINVCSTNYDGLNLNWIDTSNMTDFSNLLADFYNNTRWFNCDISEWDVSNVTDMSNMFHGCIAFNQDISKWDVRNLVEASGMFLGCKSFNQDICGWNVSKLKNASMMFAGCQAFNQDLSKWPIKDDTITDYIFEDCISLEKQISWSSRFYNSILYCYPLCKLPYHIPDFKNYGSKIFN